MKDTFESISPANESPEDLVISLETKAGVEALQQHLYNLRVEPGSALSPDLQVDSIHWPEAGKRCLVSFRSACEQLDNKLSEMIQKEGESSDADSESALTLYENFVAAQGVFADFQDEYLQVQEIQETMRTELFERLQADGYSDDEADALLQKSFDQEQTVPGMRQVRDNILNDPLRIPRVVLKNPELATLSPEEMAELHEYKQQTRKHLVPKLLARGWSTQKVDQYLDRALYTAVKKEDVERIRHNIEADPAWETPVVLAEPVSQEVVLDKPPTGESVAEPVELAENFYTLDGAAKQVVREAIKRVEDIREGIERTADSVQQLTELENLLTTARQIEERIVENYSSWESMAVKKNNLRTYAKAAQRIIESIDTVTSTKKVDLSAQLVQKVESSPVPKLDIVELIRRFERNPFYTDEERTTAKFFLQNLQSALANGKSAEQIAAARQNFAEFVTNLDQQPAAEYLPDRIAHIEAHVANASAGSSVKETIQSLIENYERIASDEAATDTRRVQAYKLIEQTALDHESDWLSVCGMQLPEVGPEKVFGARAFREGLQLVRDRHRELVGQPEKQRLVDRIIYLLSPVPNEGLSADQLAEITELARQINTDQSLIGSVARLDTAATQSAEPLQLTPEMRVGAEVQPQRDLVDEHEHTSDVQTFEIDMQTLHESTSPESLEPADSGLPWSEAERAADYVVPLKQNRGRLPISVSAEEENGSSIPIRVKSAEPVLPTVSAEQPADVRVNEGVSNAALDILDSVQKLPSNYALTWRERAAIEQQTRRASSLDQAAFDAHIAEIESVFGSEKEFDRVVKSEQERIDRKTQSRLDSWLGEQSASPFAVYANRPIAEFLALDEIRSSSAKNAEVARQNLLRELQAKKIKYESFLEWRAVIQECLAVVQPVNEQITLRELFTQFILRSAQH